MLVLKHGLNLNLHQQKHQNLGMQSSPSKFPQDWVALSRVWDGGPQVSNNLGWS